MIKVTKVNGMPLSKDELLFLRQFISDITHFKKYARDSEICDVFASFESKAVELEYYEVAGEINKQYKEFAKKFTREYFQV